jgi:murein DD-endopeptidase MepM/ murein hydrolase activator NlpD
VVLASFALGSTLHAQPAPKPKKPIKELNRSLSQVRKKQAEVRKEIRQTRAEAQEVRQDIRSVDDRLRELEDKLEVTTMQLNQGRKEQRALAEQLASAEKRLVLVKQQVQDRLKAIYMRGQGTAFTALATSRDMGEIASRKYLMETIARADRRLFEEFIALREEVARKKAQQDRVVARVRRLVNQQTAQANQLTDARQEKTRYLEQLKGKEAELAEILRQFERDEAAIEAQIRAYLASLRRPGAVNLPPFRGGFVRPVDGPITSSFGMRFHPILRVTKLHTGIDFRAATGTPIRAAASGVVIGATYLQGYGNTVILDHGSGMSTVYAHCSRIYVLPGARIARGQTIAAVGSTGYSTGPHLHFEIRVNGRPVNPMGRF